MPKGITKRKKKFLAWQATFDLSDSADMHKASHYDFYDIFAHAKEPVATVGTYFMYVRLFPTTCPYKRQNECRDVHSWRLPYNMSSPA